jgi:hypothetical protein
MTTTGRGSRTLSAPGRRKETRDIDAAEVSGAIEQSPEALKRRTEARVEALGLSLALLFAIGLGALATWGTVLLADSLRQAQALMQPQSFMVHNASPFQR